MVNEAYNEKNLNINSLNSCDEVKSNKTLNEIKKQIEFSLSDANIRRNTFIQNLLRVENKIDENKYIDLNIFLPFKKISCLTKSINDIQLALENSKILELSLDKNFVRRKFKINKDKNLNECTLYVENLPKFVDHEWAENLFSAFGKVEYVCLPKCKQTNLFKGNGFIEFEKKNSIDNALIFFNSVLIPFKESIISLNNHEDIYKKIEFKLEEKNFIEYKNNSFLIDNFFEIEKLHILTKAEWLSHKKKCRNKFKIKNGINLNDFEKGLIIKLEYIENEKTSLESIFKKYLRTICENDGIAYIDILNKKNICYIRCKNDLTVSYLTDHQKFKDLGKFYILDGNEEKIYWENIKVSLVKKKQKIMNKKWNIDLNNEKCDTNLNDENEIEYEKGLILKVEFVINFIKNDFNEKIFKRKLRDCKCYENISYIDIDESQNVFVSSETLKKVCYIRCKTIDGAIDLSKESFLLNLDKVVILEGLEELNYWRKIEKNRKLKYI